MKKLSLSLLLLGFCSFHALFALVPGDIFFTGVNTNPGAFVDNFSFVALANIPAGTDIYFTDRGWINSVNRFQDVTEATSDACLKWTAPAAGVPCGTEIVITCESGIAASLGTVVADQNSSVGGVFMEFGTTGDQIFAFQGSFAAPTFLCAFDMNESNNSACTTCSACLGGGTGWCAAGGLAVGQISSIVSEKPAALAAANILTGAPETDNGDYIGTTSGTRAALYTALTTNANWSYSVANFGLTSGANFTVTDCVPLGEGPELTVSPFQDFASLRWTSDGLSGVSLVKVQRGRNNSDFETLASLMPAAVKNETWVDYSPLSGVSYYRLVTQDASGGTRYSNIAEFKVTAMPQTLVVPSSSDGHIHIINEGGFPAGSLFQVYSLAGESVWSQPLPAVTDCEADISFLAGGVYLYTISGQNLLARGKLLIFR